jgi:signal transduction histidine kinase
MADKMSAQKGSDPFFGVAGCHPPMDSLPERDKSKPFKLVKYFSFTSLILAFLGTLVLSVFNTHWARTMEQRKSADYAHVLIENLNHQIFLRFSIPVVLKYGKIQLRDQEQFEIMDRVVRSTLHSFKVERVNIYDMDQTVSYSFEADLIGRKDMGGSAYQKARDGHFTSKVIHEGEWLANLLGISKKNQMITFAPLRAEQPLSGLSGPVSGVIEVVQDLTDDYHAIFRFQISVILTSSLVMGVLLLAMIFVVKKGETIMEQRATERLKLIEKLNRAEHLSSLGEMVAAVSHEIRNPLGIIRSSAELLKKKVAASDPSNKIPDIIVEEATRLNDIITDFLNYARPQSPSPVRCKVSELLEKNVGYLAPQLENSRCTVSIRLEDPELEVTADPNMLYQAFLNILINAMQAMPEGGHIDIFARSEGDSVVLRFEDSGPGVSAELEGKIWAPFFTTKDKGTGLGLVIVANIVRAHEGAVRLYNRRKGGACVEVNIPASPKGA